MTLLNDNALEHLNVNPNGLGTPDLETGGGSSLALSLDLDLDPALLAELLLEGRDRLLALPAKPLELSGLDDLTLASLRSALLLLLLDESRLTDPRLTRGLLLGLLGDLDKRLLAGA